VVDYPKAPEHQLSEVAANMDAIYAKALKEYGAECIFLIGDSAGGQVVLSLTQRLVAQGLPLPLHLMGVSPIVNMSMDNPDVAAIEPLDPVLAKVGIESSNRMALGSASPQSAAVSPLLGSFEGFPSTTLFLAEHDILYPDGVLAAKKMKAAGVEVAVIVGKEMIHDWPYLPFMKEATEALGQIEEAIAERMTNL
jgi:acetyl esterase/lipase